MQPAYNYDEDEVLSSALAQSALEPPKFNTKRTGEGLKGQVKNTALGGMF